MAARKLQSEIDRTLKKVSEGVELFESIYDKMQASTNQTQKEKQETDLKTQIKKLQRLRDQIKTWVASSDIKDKSALVENRKLIETQMEKFKACEKEMKTKTFSKEGLMASTKLDPAEQEKNIAMQWIQEKVEALQQQVEQAEAEIESLQAGGKKKKTNSAASERLEGLEHWNERRKWHISRLEIILRLLDNGSLKADKVKDLQEDVTYFIDSNQEDGYEEDEGIYDDFNLDEQEELFGLNADNDDAAESVSESASESVSLPQRTPSKKHEDEVVSIKREREREREPASPLLKKAGVTVIPRRVSAAAESKPPPNLNFSQTPMSSVVKAGIARPPAQLPVRYAAAAAAAVNSSAAHPPAHPPSAAAIPATAHAPTPVPAAAPSQPTVTPTPAAAPPAPSVTDSPSLTHASVASPLLSSAASAALEGSLYSARQSPALSEAIASSSPQRRIATVDTAAKHEPSHTTTNGTAVSSAVASPAISTAAPPGVSSVATTATAATAPATSPTTATQAAFPPVASSPSQPTGTEAQASVPKPESQTQQMPGQQTPSQTPGGQQRIAGSLADLVSSFESVKQKAATRMADLDSVHKLLEGGHGGAPQPLDTEKAKYYVPKNPWQTPSYYPQQPHPLLSRPEIFAQLEVETLFWIFYYNPGTYQQYLAARELKKQSWRFHVKYLTWFQRHSEPQAITDEYEQGVYVYFDWESSWCQRRKNDFRFEYRYLSED